MGNSVNELIDQMGGRERLEQIKKSASSDANETVRMARALLAVLDAKPVGTVSIAPDWNSIPRRYIATVNMRPDLVLSEMRDGDNLYTVPPAASVPHSLPDGMTTEMMRAVQLKSELGAYAAANLGGAYGLFDEFWKVAMAAAPAPENKK